ncbi:MAG: TRAP transporter small permease [Alphaproteobacteria bacterium]|nr:TRAP transporter small permease [Alphaproteobacteria bacterium]MBT7746193.1 TRAP transporter small permease [Alphaproteobacteria bacterium]
MASSNLLSRLVIGLARLCGMISALLIILVLAVVSYAVIQRYVLQTPLLWGDEFIGYVLVSIIMFGTAEALRKNDHISIDLLTSRAKPHHQRFVRIWGDTAVFLFAAMLGWSTWTTIVFAYGFGEYSMGYIEIPTWIPQVPMLLGTVLLALVALTRIFGNLATRSSE